MALEKDKLDHNTRKVRLLFETELRHAASTGMFWNSSLLFGALTTLANKFQLDTLLNESVNKAISLQGTRCPNMSLETLSSRVCTKKTIGSSSKATWKDMRANVFSAMEDCIAHADYIPKVAESSRHRWSAPQPLPPMYSRACDLNMKLPQSEEQQRLKWSAHHNILWYRSHTAKVDAQYILVVCEAIPSIAVPGHGCRPEFYLCADTLRSSGGFMLLDMVGSSRRCFAPALPITIKASMDVFGQCYDKVCLQGLKMAVFEIPCTACECDDDANSAFIVSDAVENMLTLDNAAFEMKADPDKLARKTAAPKQQAAALHDIANPDQLAMEEDNDIGDNSADESDTELADEIKQHVNPDLLLGDEEAERNMMLSDISDLLDAHDKWHTRVLNVVSKMASPPSDLQVQDAVSKLAMEYGAGCTLSSDELEMEAIVRNIVFV